MIKNQIWYYVKYDKNQIRYVKYNKNQIGYYVKYDKNQIRYVKYDKKSDQICKI